MKNTPIVGTFVFIGATGWQIGGSLLVDALGMAIGILLGILASIPTMPMVLAGNLREDYGRALQNRAERRERSQIVQNNLHIHHTPSERQESIREWRVIGAEEKVQ